jgi:hypothetical protein
MNPVEEPRNSRATDVCRPDADLVGVQRENRKLRRGQRIWKIERKLANIARQTFTRHEREC